MAENVEDSAVNDFLLILEEHRKNCERQGKYVEAEIAKNRLEELKVHEENRRKEAMRSRQIAERLGVEEAHMLEFQQFNHVWDRKMDEYERNVEELVVNMRVRRQRKLKRLMIRLLMHFCCRRSTRPSCWNSSGSCWRSIRSPSSPRIC